MDEYIEKNPPSNKCTTEKCHPMAIKLKDCKFLKKDSDLWETDKQPMESDPMPKEGTLGMIYSLEEIASLRSPVFFVPNKDFILIPRPHLKRDYNI